MGNGFFKNKVAIVSGSSMGIGKAIAQELLNLGAKVVLNGRDRQRLEHTALEFRELGYDTLPVVADIRFPAQCRQLIDSAVSTYGGLDILVNNAGISSRGSVEDMADSNYKIIAETNFNGSAHLSKYAIPHLKISKGHIIFINSVASFRGMPYNAAYSTSKMAQAGLAEALRIELSDNGVHVGITYVGFTENDPKKTILDADGSWIYLPKRTNEKLDTREHVAKSVCVQIAMRKDSITLTGLGHLAKVITRYFPLLGHWILWWNRVKIKNEYTMIGGARAEVHISNAPPRDVEELI
ncbi:SDR family oxidoreductase [Sediminicola sp. YIK13]|uniref:SDR family oxidoreductase n=1 Tax=Sediminicola sp. YIK13 TaxID=1453352 RepID=UPI000781C33A|nr:SDR family oxidoreductase [Sediminicola sp. YIK13]